jgi:hypothetical protein
MPTARFRLAKTALGGAHPAESAPRTHETHVFRHGALHRMSTRAVPYHSIPPALTTERPDGARAAMRNDHRRKT